ncbi:sigma-70 family RNA polymerase sigma factor [Desulfosporosinus sp. PR]|uniref:RNA polymerase sigma factor n=1 Tax=Candidatus Desulfosporosinus nitrosoreducens TaxID=3401928 RepID=UPI0027E65B03|nr:sigma-70 family RNA polymerase sigma factor [Desulfosporosinus sp. PR]MDQ7093185.1 sigma-70 family RNA polymerase sigma factor [Desulfosporosinus sp. PR]
MSTGNSPLEVTFKTIADLYRHFELPIYRYLLRLCGSGVVAQELTQETFLQVLTSWQRYKGTANVKTWLYKIARNVYLHQNREATRSTRLFNKLVNEQMTRQPSHNSPEAILERRCLSDTVNEVLQALPEQYRTVILLKETENLSHREIADILNKTEASAKVMFFRAKQKFIEEYERLGGSP